MYITGQTNLMLARDFTQLSIRTKVARKSISIGSWKEEWGCFVHRSGVHCGILTSPWCCNIAEKTHLHEYYWQRQNSPAPQRSGQILYYPRRGNSFSQSIHENTEHTQMDINTRGLCFYQKGSFSQVCHNGPSWDLMHTGDNFVPIQPVFVWEASVGCREPA